MERQIVNYFSESSVKFKNNSESLKKIFLIVLILAGITVNKSFPQIADDKVIRRDGDLNAEQIIDKYKTALISIWMTDKNYYSHSSSSYIDTNVLNGSGFIYSEEGLIGTNYHVVKDIDSLLVKTSDGTFYNAELLVKDEANDFAIIKLLDTDEKKFPFVILGNSDNVKAGNEVYAIGSPLGFEYTISSGIVAAVRDNERVSISDPYTYENKEMTYEKVLQITAAISPGNSGGALFNSKGEVIGVTTFTYIGYGNLNFAVAINTFKKLAELEKTKEYLKERELFSSKENSQFNSNYKNALDLKQQLAYDWYYSKQKDTMKTPDEFLLTQDSVNRSKLTRAENLFRECINIKPDTFLVYQDLLELYVITDNNVKAENLYREIKEKFNSDSLLNLLSSNLASAYSNSKNYKKALQFYEKLLSQDQTQYYIYYEIAGLYAEMNDYKKAISEYKKLLAVYPEYNDANIQLGKIYYENFKNLNKAKKYLQKAYETELQNTGNTPYNVDLLYYLGKIAVKEGRKLDAILTYIDLKNVYSYDSKDYEKKLDLYRDIQKMDE